jgi:hypothetical protein
MMTFGSERSCVVCSAVLVICALHAHGQEQRLPTLGSRAPSWVPSARAHSETCLTDVNHRDPCATVTIKSMLFKIAWDRETSAVTFLLTEDPHLVTDSELGIGGGCRLLDGADQPYPLTPYLGWLFTPMWADSVEDLSGDAVWYAALRKESTLLPYGRIVGFVQSRYLKVKE